MKVTIHGFLIGVLFSLCSSGLQAQVGDEQLEEVPVPVERLVPPLPTPPSETNLARPAQRPPLPRGLAVLQQLGVTLMPGATSGLQVRSIQRGSLADQTGLRPRDTIVAINNKPVASITDVPAQPAQKLTILRGASQQTLTVPVTQPVAPKPDQPTFSSRQYSYRRTTSPTYSTTPTNHTHGYNHYRFSGNTDVGPNTSIDVGVDANGYPLYPFLWGYGFGPPYFYGRPPFYGKHYKGSPGSPHPYRGGQGGGNYRGSQPGVHHDQRGGR